MRAEMPYGIVRLIDRRQPAIFTALPPTAFLLRKNSAGLFDEGKSDDDKEENRRNTCVFQGSMTPSALICTWGPHKVVRPCGERRTHRSGEGCPSGSARLKRRLRPTKKRVCPCQAKVLRHRITSPTNTDEINEICRESVEFTQSFTVSLQLSSRKGAFLVGRD